MITVAMVYKMGGDYGVEYVERLAHGIRRNITGSCRIVCLTDSASRTGSPWDLMDDVTPLDRGWPGWWSKVELFRLPGPLLYLDLDTIVVGNLDPLVRWAEDHKKSLLMLRGFYRRDQCSGVLAWNDDVRWLFELFERDVADATFSFRSGAVRMKNRRGVFRGDQEWLGRVLRDSAIPPRVVVAQDVLPGVYSYKVDIKDSGRLPDDARMICFHGHPRPHEVNPVPPWMRVYWSRLGVM